jgi:hypothetical protein
MDNPVIVEVEGYEGEDGQIVVENYRAERIGMGRPNTIYCIASVDKDGLVRLTDWGYATLEEARTALGYRKSAQSRKADTK